MNAKTNDIELTKTEEADEINAREAKQVEACAFQAQGAGSSPVASTNDWWIESKGNDFEVKRRDINIGGNFTGRYSVLT